MGDNTSQITQKDIFDLSETEFISYFKEKIGPKYDEIKNKKEPNNPLNKIQMGCIFIFIIPTIFISLIFFIVAIKFISKNLGYGIFLMVFSAIILLNSISVIRRIIKIKNKNLTNRGDLKEKILNLLGFQYLNCSFFGIKKDYDKIKKAYDVYGKILEQTFGTVMDIEEIIQGCYHNMPFAVLDLFETENKRKFHRTFLAVKINRKISSQLWLYNKGNILSSTRPILNVLNSSRAFQEIVNLEDVNFVKEYKVYAQDQVEARYLLTPTFMERLLKYRRERSCGIDVAFTSKYVDFYNLFFYIETDKNLFELPAEEIFDIEISAKYFYQILQEIKEILFVVDALKLDQDIGM